MNPSNASYVQQIVYAQYLAKKGAFLHFAVMYSISNLAHTSLAWSRKLSSRHQGSDEPLILLSHKRLNINSPPGIAYVMSFYSIK